MIDQFDFYFVSNSSAHQVQHCILDRMENHPGCSKSSLKLYREIVNGIVSDSLDLICSTFKDGSDNCKENNRLALSIATDKGPGKSMLIPLITVLNSL